MKLLTTLTASAMLVACAPAMADESAKKQVCYQRADAAATFMTARQVGRPLRELLEVLEKSDMEDLNSVAIEAFQQPRYSSSEYREDAITDFANKKLVECLKYFKVES